jgi:hypothetical protein
MPCEVFPWQGIIQNCFVKCGSSTASSVNANYEYDDENCKLVELQGHSDCPSTFNKFLNVYRSVPTTSDHPTNLDSPGPSFMHVTGKEEKKTQETRLLPN